MMRFIKIVLFRSVAAQKARRVRLLLFLLGVLVSSNTWAVERAYYSGGGSVSSPAPANVTLSTSNDANTLTLAATATTSASSAVKVRLKLNGGIAPAGYRAGMLVSNSASSLAQSGLTVVTLRTFLNDVPQEARIVDASLVQAALLNNNNLPAQFEFNSTKDFNQIEIEFGAAGYGNLGVSLGGRQIQLRYAYGIGQELPKPATGFLSQFGTAASSQYSTDGTDKAGGLCLNSYVINPERAVDGDLTNYATFSTLAGLSLDPSNGCLGTLRVSLAGVVPSTGFRAGFVIGNSGLLDASLVSGLRLHTFRNGVRQQVASAADLLQVSLLADGQAMVSFLASKEFDAVGIERTGNAALLDNLRLYYGFGLDNASFTSNPAVTSYPLSTNNYTVNGSGVLCALCSSNVVTPTNGTQPYINLSQTVGAVGTQAVQFPLTGSGVVGNRAGVVLGTGTLLDVNALNNTTLVTYDAAGSTLETANTSSLLGVNLLPDGRQEVSFRTTRNFAAVGLVVKAGVSALNNLAVYSAFADDRGGLLVTGPVVLPVVLTSFGVSRAAGAATATITWATASERHSARFVVERSTNPKAGFWAVGEVAAAGTSMATRQYSLRDATAPTGTTSYYRLRQLDLDGSEHLSPVVVLAATTSPELASGFTLYPNPATGGTVSLTLPTPAQAGTTAVIYSSLGRALRQQTVGGSEAEAASAPVLATVGLPAGIYSVVLQDAAGQRLGTQRLVINN
jgi:hypothetical protein